MTRDKDLEISTPRQNKRLGDMTPDERKAAIASALRRLEREFARPEVQKAISAALNKEVQS